MKAIEYQSGLIYIMEECSLNVVNNKYLYTLKNEQEHDIIRNAYKVFKLLKIIL